MSGLEGVVAAETRISRIDRDGGELIVRGLGLSALVDLGFEGAASHLWERPVDRLGVARLDAWSQLQVAPLADAMDGLRAMLARSEDDRPEAIVAALAVCGAAWFRARAGAEPIAPDPTAGHGADILRMCGLPHDRDRARALETYLVTVMEHGMNASTFAARVVTSTGSDAVSAVVAAIGALKGPLHGGAPGPVLQMLHDIGQPQRAEPWLRAELAAGRRIMGFGHRVYRDRDPRAAVLEAAVQRLAPPGLPLARQIEIAAVRVLSEHKPGRVLQTNVEFYTAVLLDALGFEPGFFTALFSMGRAVGWLAHVQEQRETGRLIRPSARYIGPLLSAPDTPRAAS